MVRTRYPTNRSEKNALGILPHLKKANFPSCSKLPLEGPTRAYKIVGKKRAEELKN